MGLLIMSTMFLAGIFRMVCMSTRYGRSLGIVVMVVAIIINVSAIVPMTVQVPRKPTAGSRRRLPAQAPQPGQQDSPIIPQDTPGNPPPSTDPSQPVNPGSNPKPASGPGAPQPSTGSPSGTSPVSPKVKGEYMQNPKWTDHVIGIDTWILAMILMMLQWITWFWYSITYMPCARQCVHACCKKKSKKQLKKEEGTA